MDLCLICLRTDKSLKQASDELEEFHDDLCEFSLIALTSTFYYCNECEYFLLKFCKFKEKCVQAANIYKKWLATSASKKRPIKLLHTLLPPSSIGKWVPTDRIGNYTFNTQPETDGASELEVVNETLIKEVKLELEQSCNSDDINHFEETDIDDVLKTETTDKISKDDLKVEKNSKRNNSKDDKARDKCSKKEETKKVSKKREKCNDKDKERRELLEKLDKLLEDDSDDDGKVDVEIEKKSQKIVDNILKSKGKKTRGRPKKQSQIEKMEEHDRQYDSMFDVEYLRTREAKMAEFEKRKTYECYVNAKYRCEICYQVLKYPKHLDYHNNKCHVEKPGTVCCPICKTWYPENSAHNRKHRQVYKCKLCSLVTYNRMSMVNHFEWHQGKQHHCKECNLTYKSISMYRTHVGKVHRQGRNVCSVCGRGFYSPFGLLMHKRNSRRCKADDDDGGKPTTDSVRCDECDVTLPSQEVYEAHIADVHASPRVGRGRPLAADGAGLPPCRLNWKKASNSVRQIKKRIKPATYTCRVCDVIGGSFVWLQLHFKHEHPTVDIDVLYADKKKYLCDMCGAGFASKYVLRDHIYRHTGALPYSCDMCPKKFHSSARRNHHRLRHFPSTLACSYCGKLFKTAANLYSHNKIHIGERNHKCDICGKAFLHSASVRAHVRGVHYNIKRAKRGDTAGKTRGKTTHDDFSYLK